MNIRIGLLCLSLIAFALPCASAGTLQIGASGCAASNITAVTATATGWTANVSAASTLSGCAAGIAPAPTPTPTPTPTPSASCPNIASSTTGIAHFSRLAGPQKVYADSGISSYKEVDVGSFDALFGAWPGIYGLIDYFALSNDNYLSMQFKVPPNYMTAANRPNPLYGAYESGESGNDADYSITISRRCGDFSNPATNPTSSVVPGCWKNKLQTKGLLQWNSPAGSNCALPTGQNLFLNFINADISQVHPGGGTAASTRTASCKNGACRLPVYNGPGTWGGYTPKP